MRLIISPGICGSKERRLEDGGDDKDEERREEDMTRYLKRSANSRPDAASLLDERRVCTSWGNYAVSHDLREAGFRNPAASLGHCPLHVLRKACEAKEDALGHRAEESVA